MSNDRQNTGFHFMKNIVKSLGIISFFNTAKFLRLSHLYKTNDFLNLYISHKPIDVDLLKATPEVNFFEESKVMFSEHKPVNNDYPNKCLLLVGGRHSFVHNYDFVKSITDDVNITVISFQYDGYYGSGTQSELTMTSYLNSASEAYKYASKYGEVYVVGYSLGCYAAYKVNQRRSIFLIAPFYSIGTASRGLIDQDELNIHKAILKNPLDNIIIQTYTLDFLTPSGHLKDIFNLPNVKHVSSFGNHATGSTTAVIPLLKEYINS